MTKNNRQTIQVAFTYVGAVIGAGFASGQEILQFFTLNPGSYIGILICGLLFTILGYFKLKIALDFNLYTYHQFFNQLGGRKIANFANIVTFLFLFGSLIVMLSGSGEIFSSYFQLSKSLGILLTFMIMALAVKFGIEGVMKLNLFLIPLLMIVIFFIFFVNVELNFISTSNTLNISELPKLIFYSIIYASYNLFLALPVLIAIPSRVQQERLLRKGSILAGSIIITLALIVNFLLMQNLNLIKESQVPILDALSHQQSAMYLVYSVILWLAMLTTGSSNLYGLIVELKEKLPLSLNKLLVLFALITFCLARLPFADLVAIIYPSLGNIGLIIIIFLFLKYLKEKIIV
ncbi:YkvI family membrane protein [Fuchsiella alkaliacetigena]|uniref:YkvI family membrane protein n=1 Tax=Fuchsiella alkaliacetigena TaxID=957042 RepID=UPI00200AE06D|nr:hypothetical protein [Fuchsiella alkaliacetigena]MCK8824545.1 hypothetical protein [Fuchsiella alkaliacetigena]